MLNVHIGDPFGLGLGLECRRCAGEASPLTKHTLYTGDRDRDRDRDRTVYLQDVMHKLQMSKLEAQATAGVLGIRNNKNAHPSGVAFFTASKELISCCKGIFLVSSLTINRSTD